MKTTRMVGAWMVLGAAAILLGGCATTKQARGIEEGNGVLLTDYSLLREGKDGEALRVYKSEKANWAAYKKVLIDPVLFPKPDNASSSELADLQKLADNLYVQLSTQLGADFVVVAAPGPDTLRVQSAFFDVSKKRVVMNTLSSVIPVGAAVSVVKDFATGKPMSVGEISGELKVTDAQTGVLLAAALDRRVGQKYSGGMFSSWAEANDAMEYWAKRMRFAACQLRGGSNCVEP